MGKILPREGTCVSVETHEEGKWLTPSSQNGKAAAVAERLGTTVVEFPSYHVGYMTHPRAFAERLHEMLGDEQGK